MPSKMIHRAAMLATAAACIIAPNAAGAGTLTAIAPNAAGAGTLTAIAPYSGATPGSTQSLIGINNAGWTTGSINTVNSATNTVTAIGYIRDPSGNYTTFSYDDYTQGRAVSNSNVVVGFNSNNSGGQQTEFTRTATGTATTLTNPGTGQPLNGIAQGINDNGLVVGNYLASSGPGTPSQRDGFILNLNTNGFTTLTPDVAHLSVSARGINDQGAVVGFATNASTGFANAMIYSGGAYTYLDPVMLGGADAIDSVLEGVNNNGIAVGTWQDSSYANHGFEYDLNTHTVTQLNQLAPEEALTTWGINDSGQIVMSSSAGQFIYDPNAAVSAPDGSAVFAPTVGISLPPNVSQFTFNVVAGQTYYIDPAAAGGYIYDTDGGPLFASFTAPTGYAPGDLYQLWLFDQSLQRWVFDTDVTGGQAFTFDTPVGLFELRGLNVGPNSPDFVTGLTFATDGAFNGQQTAIAAPEPAAWTLLIAGFGLAGASLRRKRRALA